MTDAELVKSKIDIVDFLSDFIQLKKAGRNFKALCPFHGEKTPSFIVSPERQSWYCFGACGEGGDVISFLQKWENLEFLDSLKILARKTGVKLTSFAPTEKSKQKQILYEINHLASEFYHYLLTTHSLGAKARQYLKERGIKKQTIETFSLGYAPKSWKSLFRYLAKKGYKKTDAVASGLLIKSQNQSIYDRFRGRLMFTLKDHHGNIIGFSGRKIPSVKTSKDEKIKEAKYINTPETPIYVKGQVLYGLDVTREKIKKEKEAIIVEGEFDLLSSFQAGVSNCVAIKGSALTHDQVMLLKRFTDNIILALDSDFAGNEAAKRGIEIADEAGLSIKVVNLPYGKDPADCIQKSAHLFQDAIKKAVPVYDFILDAALKKYDKNDVAGKKKIGGETTPFLAKITNPIIQSHYIKKLASELKVSEESIYTSIRQFEKKKDFSTPAQTSKKKVNRLELLEEYFLALVVQSKNPAKVMAKVTPIIDYEDLHIAPVKKIFETLSNYLSKREKLDVKKFGQSLNPEIIHAFDKAYMLDLEKVLKDEHFFLTELTKTIKEIKKAALRRRLEDISTKIKVADEENDEEKIAKLNEKQREHLKDLAGLDKLVVSN